MPSPCTPATAHLIVSPLYIMIRVFTHKSNWTPKDDLSFVGDPSLFRPTDDIPVRISCVFTWRIEEAERLKRSWSRFYSDVQVGGPAYDDRGNVFVPGRFVKYGITITSRGCPNDCEWCLVPRREGKIRELPIMPGWNVNDNNLLACSEGHIERVFDMLREQKTPIVFSGGLDARIFGERHADLLRSINLGEAWFACDYPGAIDELKNVAELLPDINPRKKRTYVLTGFNGDTISQAEKRLETVFNFGFWPFAMLYRSSEALKRNEWSKDWLKLQKIWTRPALFKTKMANKPFQGMQKDAPLN